MRRRRYSARLNRLASFAAHFSRALSVLTAVLLLLLDTFCLKVTAEVQIQRISDRVVPVPGGNVKGVIATITDDGPLRGRLVEQFYGIQFASVPERFQPPERPTDQWQGNRILWNPAPACPGPEYGGGAEDLKKAGYNRVARMRLAEVISASKVFDSDMYDWESTCLKMNIFVPYENRTANPNLKPNPRAVLVFIPAESYDFGSANAYNPTPLVAFGDIIVVTLNIRHGALGFLASGEQSSSGAPGNMALFDVVSALHWIRANIAAFGGDPHRITLLGHQHAAALVHLLMASPVVRGNRLFQRAILQGGSALSPYAIQSLAAAQSSMLALGLAAGCSEPLLRQVPILMRCLRNKTVQQLSNINLKPNGVEDGFQSLVSSFGPTITSGNLLSIDLQELNERRLPYDVLLGASAHSGTDLIPDECLTARGCNSTDRMRLIKSLVKTVFHETRRRIVDVLAHQYKDHRRPDAPDSIAVELAKLLGDSYVVAPLIKTANIQANKGRGNSVYFYVFDYGQSPLANSTPVPNPAMPVSFPGDELSYIFGAPLVSNLPPFSNKKFFPEERFLSETMMSYWANFVKTGNPNTPSPKPAAKWWRTAQVKDEVAWPTYTVESRDFLRLGAQIEPDQRYKADMMALWLDLIPRLHSDGVNGNGGSISQPPLFPPPPPMPPPPLFMTEPGDVSTPEFEQRPSDESLADFRRQTSPPTVFEEDSVTWSTQGSRTTTTLTPRGVVKPSKIADVMIVINPDEIPETASSEKLILSTEEPLVLESTTESSSQEPNNNWVPVVISGPDDANGLQKLLTTTTTVGPSHGHVNNSIFATMPLPLLVTVAIVSSLVVGNIVICVVVYCIRRKRRRQAAEATAEKGQQKHKRAKSRTPPTTPSSKTMGNGTGNSGSTKHLNGTGLSPAVNYNNRNHRGSLKTSEELRPLNRHEELISGGADITFRGSQRRFDIPLETQIDTPSVEDLTRFQMVSNKHPVATTITANGQTKSITSSESFDWRRQQHQQQLSAALTNSSNNHRVIMQQQQPQLSPGRKGGHLAGQKFNSSGRLSVSLEDFNCSLEESNVDAYLPNRMTEQSPPLPARRREPPPDDANRNLLMRRNSLPKQIILQGGDKNRFTAISAHGLNQPSEPVAELVAPNSSTLPRHQTPIERELAPTSAIRLVNHSRIVTPPSSANSAASPPTSSSSAMSQSPLPPPPAHGNPGARLLNNVANNNKCSMVKLVPPEPAVCFLPAYRTASLDTNTSSPVSLIGLQITDRALPAPPPPPKPKQLLARYNHYSQQVKVVKFCEETTEIPHEDESCLHDGNGRALPPSPPMEESSSPPPSAAHRKLPQTPNDSQFGRAPGGVMTNWSKMAVENNGTPLSPKKSSANGGPRVTGL